MQRGKGEDPNRSALPRRPRDSKASAWHCELLYPHGERYRLGTPPLVKRYGSLLAASCAASVVWSRQSPLDLHASSAAACDQYVRSWRPKQLYPPPSSLARRSSTTEHVSASSQFTLPFACVHFTSCASAGGSQAPNRPPKELNTPTFLHPTGNGWKSPFPLLPPPPYHPVPL